MASDVRVRRLGPEEGLLAAALHVQSLRAAGGTAPPGHFDRFADVWSGNWAHLPTWVAEHDGDHAGLLMVQLPPPLPAGVGSPQWARAVLVYAVPAGPTEQALVALLGTAARWLGTPEAARPAGPPAGLELAEGVTVAAGVLDALGAQVIDSRRTRIPSRF